MNISITQQSKNSYILELIKELSGSQRSKEYIMMRKTNQNWTIHDKGNKISSQCVQEAKHRL